MFSEDILNAEVTYQLASETLNNEGVKYGEYGIHNESYDIDAIFYDGSVYKGKKTKVFAYLGIPKNASLEKPVPAVVCVHGGWGKAEISWVKKWNDKGYAAIAMDLYGNGPVDGTNNPDDRTGKLKHPYSGMFPWNDYGTAFLSDYENAGMYHNVLNVINAHNLIRNHKLIDKEKTGITGISWGGITTTIVSGIDSRFKFAAPIYGCGFLYMCHTYFKNAFDKEETTKKWDPSNFAKKAKMPVLYVNGDSDPHFSVNSSSLTYEATPDAYLSIRHNLVHGQPEGESIEQVYSFAKHIFEADLSYIKFNEVHILKNVLNIKYSGNENIQSVEAYYITDEELPFGGGENISWNLISQYTIEENKIKIILPENATFCYCSLTDNRGNIISTEFIEIKKEC